MRKIIEKIDKAEKVSWQKQSHRIYVNSNPVTTFLESIISIRLGHNVTLIEFAPNTVDYAKEHIDKDYPYNAETDLLK